MKRLVAAMVSVIVGGWLGWVIAQHTGAYGHDESLQSVSISADGQSITVRIPQSGILTADESPTQVRLRLHISPTIDFDAGDGHDQTLSVRLRAPVGSRDIIDVTAPAVRRHFLRPAWLPAGFTGAGDKLEVTPAEKLIESYASPDGGMFMIELDPGASGGTRPVTGPASYATTGGGYLITVSTPGWADRLTADQMQTIGNSMR